MTRYDLQRKELTADYVNGAEGFQDLVAPILRERFDSGTFNTIADEFERAFGLIIDRYKQCTDKYWEDIRGSNKTVQST